MINSPLISIIIPTHNRPELLSEAIDSVALQNINNIEIIVIDDCSTPPVDEQLLIDRFGKYIRVIRHQYPKGGAAAKNTGIESAQGKYIAFLDDDDLYADGLLTKAVKHLEDAGIKTLFLGVEWFGENANDYNQKGSIDKIIRNTKAEPLNEDIIKFNGSALYEALLEGVPMAFQRPFCLKKDFMDIGLYDEKCLLWDCEWALRACLKGDSGLLNLPLYLQRSSGQSYYSKPNRRIEQAKSDYEIKKQLLTGDLSSHLTEKTQKAAIKAGQNLSWEHIKQENYWPAIKCSIETVKFGLSYSQLKFLIHIFYHWAHRIAKVKTE